MKVKNINELKKWDYIYGAWASVSDITKIDIKNNMAVITTSLYWEDYYKIDDEWNFITAEIYLFNSYLEKIYNWTWRDDKDIEKIICDNIVYEYDYDETIYNKKWDEIIKFYWHDDTAIINITKKTFTID